MMQLNELNINLHIPDIVYKCFWMNNLAKDKIFINEATFNGLWIIGPLVKINDTTFSINGNYVMKETISPKVLDENPELQLPAIYVNDVIEWTEGDDLYRGVVRFGKYLQDGSGGEYEGSKALGVYIQVIAFKDPCETDPDNMSIWPHMKQRGIYEVINEYDFGVKMIGTIFEPVDKLIPEGWRKINIKEIR